MPRTDNNIQNSRFEIQDARSEHILKKAAKIRLLISDVDGVLTDGSITYTSSGQEIKSFSVLDGLGIKLLMEAGVKFCILSSRSSAVTARRAEELGIDLVFQGVGQKLPASRDLLNKLGLPWEAVAYVGDDQMNTLFLFMIQNSRFNIQDYGITKEFVQATGPEILGLQYQFCHLTYCPVSAPDFRDVMAVAFQLLCTVGHCDSKAG